MKLTSISPSLVGASILFSFSTHAALVAVDLDGNALNGHEGVYDDVLDITWLADANLAASNTFGVGADASGSMNWDTAQNFVAAMRDHNSGDGFLGVNTWRQPSASGNCTEYGCGDAAADTDDELGYHYYQNFVAVDNGGMTNGSNTNNLDLFTNIQDSAYWTRTETAPDAPSAFIFDTFNGDQRPGGKEFSRYVWAVANGNVGTVIPVPAAAWLFGSSLAGLLVIRKRNYGVSQ